MKRIICFVLVLCCMLSLCACKSQDYTQAIALIEKGENDSAYTLVSRMGSYKAAKEIAFYLSAYKELAENNKVEAASKNLMNSINNYTTSRATIVDSGIDSVRVLSETNSALSLMVTASCTMITSLNPISSSDSYLYTLDCSSSGLDIDTCAKIITMSTEELIAYANSKQ